MDVDELARAWRASLPGSLIALVVSPEWQGGKLVQLESELARPNSQEIALNFPWLHPVVQRFPQAVPSGFFLADCMLWLDKMLGETMLRLACMDKNFKPHITSRSFPNQVCHRPGFADQENARDRGGPQDQEAGGGPPIPLEEQQLGTQFMAINNERAKREKPDM